MNRKPGIRRSTIPVCYNKLWKTDFIKAARITTNAMVKLWKNEDVRVGLVKICRALHCTLDDIVEILLGDQTE